LRIEPHCVTTIRRELILRKQLANSDEHQSSPFESDEPHPAKPHSDMTAGIVGEDDLIGRQRHSETVREEDKGAWRTVSENRQRRRPVLFPQKGRRRCKVDEQWQSVARRRGINERRSSRARAPARANIDQLECPSSYVHAQQQFIPGCVCSARSCPRRTSQSVLRQCCGLDLRRR
jgi:hypothetical protein